ncbi:MAG: 30S ribosomal protein S5 [Candidatus Pacebacteria bacterium]|nr:30S ribosomal protein S5 [Candidatus Paceibacterota bacterium]
MTEDKTTKKDEATPERKRNEFGAKKRFEKNRRRQRPERKQEFEQKIVDIRRVVRVMGGGRRFSFSVTMIIGDKKGRVGVGVGKSDDTSLAIEKATRDAKKHMITVNLTEDMSIEHDVKAKYGASVVEIRPAKGKGLVAGASVRSVLELAGVKDVTSKIWSRSKNKINNSRATIEALKQLEDVAKKPSKSVDAKEEVRATKETKDK